MIEEDGRVVRVDDGFAWVETQRPGACGGCAAGKGCGISALGGVLGRRKAPVRVINRIGAVAGDQVVIAISEAGLLRASLAVYLVPLAGLFVGALSGQYLGSGWLKETVELSSLVGGVAGFAAALVWLRRLGRAANRDDRYQPVLLRRKLPGRSAGIAVP